MKTIIKGIVVAIAVILAFADQTFAIEGIKLSVLCSDVILS